MLPLASLAGLLFALGASAEPYLNASAEYASGALGAAPHQTFKSSAAQPVLFNFQQFPSSSPPEGKLFIAPRGTDVSRAGATIMEWNGELVWDGHDFGEAMRFTPTTFRGQPVIAQWQGTFNAAGYGNGRGLVLDRTYAVIANFTVAIDGHPEAGVDFHEYQITSNDTALVTSYVTEQANLTAYNGPADGYIMLGYAQEVNITSGEALWTWRSLDHVSPSMGYAEPGGTGTSRENPWDYFHINSVEKDAAGNYLLSARHTCAVYYVSAADGSLLWVMGGKNSTIDTGGVTFGYQHDARFHPASDTPSSRQVSIFDNAGTGWVHIANSSRGLVFSVDEAGKTATLIDGGESLPFNQTVSDSQGSFDAHEGGRWLAGWGQIPVVSEHQDGKVLWSAQFGVGDVQSYRAHRAPWQGYPTTNPDVAVANGTLYVSWNGATDVKQWELLAAENDQSGDASQRVNTVGRSGFETAIEIGDASHNFYQVRAVDANNKTLGYSSFIAANGTVGNGPATSPTSPPPVEWSSPSTQDGASSPASRTAMSGAVVLAAALGAIACAI